MKKLAVIAITQNGIDTGAMLKTKYPQIDLLTLSDKGLTFDQNQWKASWATLKELTAEVFSRYDGLVYVMAVGIVVRMIAPHITTKDHDPAIVVIDEKTQFTISLLSGHLGGGNDLTRELSEVLGNQSVITTATDVNQVYALDSFAADHQLCIEPISAIARYNMALLQGERIDLVVERGLIFDDFYPSFPISQYCRAASKHQTGLQAMVTHKLHNLPGHTEAAQTIFLRPPNLILGAGCRKDYPPELFEQQVLTFLEKHQLSVNSIREIRSIRIKEQETAMIRFADTYKIPFVTFEAAEINKVYDDHPDLERSDFVHQNTGAWGVAEPVCLIGADNKPEGSISLLHKKEELSGMTLAMAIEEPYRITKKSRTWLER